jgi:hypothetical protein
MISAEEADRLAEGWIAEFSVDPYTLRQREMKYWFELDRLIHDRPRDALTVFEAFTAKNMINWTFEGVAAGPLRTFLMVYHGEFDRDIGPMRKRSPAFNEMYEMAVAGM